jgi:hypothetical protein
MNYLVSVDVRIQMIDQITSELPSIRSYRIIDIYGKKSMPGWLKNRVPLME